VWYQLGSYFLSDEMRDEALLEHVMRVTKTELCTSGENAELDADDDDSRLDEMRSGIVFDTCHSPFYCVS